MNIFILDWDPDQAARWHCDKHAVKMPVETAQILSTALSYHHGVPAPYRPTHPNHPCTVWASRSLENYAFTCAMLDALGREYSRRYGRTHRSWMILPELFEGGLQVSDWPEEGFTPPAQAMPDKYRCEDAVQAYQSYYINEKRHIAKYDRCPDGMPSWLSRGIPLSKPTDSPYSSLTHQR